ncbi:MAG TPA: hypothetical protein VM846_01500 [Vicinamibacterales bacterium]|nr:hypothetical protein [Vicinamibacterales bacterium]
MHVIRLASASAVALALTATFGSVSASGEAAKPENVKAGPVASAKSVTASVKFAALKGIKASPMTSRELETVKGLHVHFLDAGGGKLHLAGDVKHMNNWENIGGTDGLPVAPSYNGLCVAHASGGIFIPTMGPITTECP